MLPDHFSAAERPVRQALADHAGKARHWHLADLFADDAGRFETLSRECCGLLVDYSKQRLTAETLDLLRDLARARDLEGWIRALFQGSDVNWTEARPALHWRLREQAAAAPEVHDQLARMGEIVDQVLRGQWRGCHGDAITDVVNVGVGGSDLGPLMASYALGDFRPEHGRRPNLHFVSSMDGSQIAPLLNDLNPATTLVVVSSKSFTTLDTLANAETARAWLERAFPDQQRALMRCHFVGVSANPEGFHELLEGAREMDRHFREAPLADNLPVILGLVDVWNINFLDITARAVLPYDGRLKHFPSYLEQLEMESNGKSVTRDGTPVDYHTCPVIWGEVGSNAQHAFYQLLHQGTQPVACDFIVAGRYVPPHGDAEGGEHQRLARQHRLTLANCLAQSRLLALGGRALPDDQHDQPAFKQYRGNQPSTTLMLDELSPRRLGSLVALYEHKVFVESVLWGINPFDQWGVEMGKVIARDMVPVLETGDGLEGLDASTQGLVRRARS